MSVIYENTINTIIELPCDDFFKNKIQLIEYLTEKTKKKYVNKCSLDGLYLGINSLKLKMDPIVSNCNLTGIIQCFISVSMDTKMILENLFDCIISKVDLNMGAYISNDIYPFTVIIPFNSNVNYERGDKIKVKKRYIKCKENSIVIIGEKIN